MLKHLLGSSILEYPPSCREGDLYKIVTINGHRFPLYYGYYEDCDKDNPAVDPMPIYPDFIKEPCYTILGEPFVTQMQDPCPHYRGKDTPDKCCAECAYYQHGDELIGTCACHFNKQPNES